MARPRRRHWARPLVSEDRGGKALKSYAPRFKNSCFGGDVESEKEYYQEKLQDMDVSSELVWVGEKGSEKKGFGSRDGQRELFADIGELVLRPNQVTVATSTTMPEENSACGGRSEGCPSTSLSSPAEGSDRESKGSNLKEKLKKNLQRLKRRSRLTSANKSKPRQSKGDGLWVDNGLDIAPGSSKAIEEGKEEDAGDDDVYSDSFESFDSESPSEEEEEDGDDDDDAFSLLGSGSDVCCYDVGALEDVEPGSAKKTAGSAPVVEERKEGSEGSREEEGRPAMDTFGASTMFRELPEAMDDLSYDDLIGEYIDGLETEDTLILEDENSQENQSVDFKGSLPAVAESDSTPQGSKGTKVGADLAGRGERRMPLNSLESFCNTEVLHREVEPKAAQVASTKESSRAEEEAEVERCIPVLPSGLVLRVVVHSNWGDKDFVGLNGIEIFDEDGHIVCFSSQKRQVALQSEDGQDHPEARFSSLEKLTDGNNLTCDESHIWLLPFNQETKPSIVFSFSGRTSIGAIRIWNYNKSRIHSHRGAKKVELILDDTRIFHGDVQKAPGIASEAWKGAETILFTTNEETFKNIELFDAKYSSVLKVPATEIERSTKSLVLPPIEMVELEEDNLDLDDSCLLRMGVLDARDTDACEEEKRKPLSVKELVIEVVSTWGDEFYVGLAGLELLDDKGCPMEITMDHLTAEPLDLNVMPESCTADDRTLDKLLNGNNVTTDDINMWLAPLDWEDQANTISIDLKSRRKVSGLRLWNYNKSLEDTLRGVKCVKIYADGKMVSPACGHLIPKAPGVSSFDFSYTITFDREGGSRGSEAGGGNPESALWLSALPSGAGAKIAACRSQRPNRAIKQGWEVPILPCGFVFKLELFSTWGDPHYIGLTGIEIVDALSGSVLVPAASVAAEPRGVCELEGMEKDVRLPSRLTDGHNKAEEVAHCWLAPYSESSPNLITIYVSRPIVLAAVRIWNYAKTPSRGAKDFHMYLDDNLIFDGVLQKYHAGLGEDYHQALLFTRKDDLVRLESEYTSEPGDIDPAEVIFTNNNQVVRGKAETRARDLGPRPVTSVVL